MFPPFCVDPTSLTSAIVARPGSCVALVGAGGKTTTMLRLAAEYAGNGGTALVTTTTKIWPPEGMWLVLDAAEDDDDAALRRALTAHRLVALADRRNTDGKLQGVPPQRVCALHEERVADLIVCEADGAAGRSLKSHRPGEPVIPGSATHVLVLAGLDALGQPVSPAWVHRVSEFCRVTGAAQGDAISPGHMARALVATAVFAPPAARVWFVLTKVRGAAREAGAGAVAKHIAALIPDSPVITLAPPESDHLSPRLTLRESER